MCYAFCRKKNEDPRSAKWERKHASIIWPFFARRTLDRKENKPINPDNAWNFLSFSIQLDAKFIMYKAFYSLFAADALLIVVSPDTCHVTLKLDDILYCKYLYSIQRSQKYGTGNIFYVITNWKFVYCNIIAERASDMYKSSKFVRKTFIFPNEICKKYNILFIR